MVDLHSHLLPGIDDGPDDMEGTVALARAVVADGTRVIAATPHCREDHPRVKPDELASRAEDVRGRLSAEGLSLEVVQGGEVAITWAASASDDDLRLVSFGGRGTDVLVETPHTPLQATFDISLESIVLRGYRVLLAHPEVNPTFQREPDRLRDLAARGTLLQITARSLLGGTRRGAATRLARSLVGDGIAHVLASDAHSAGSFRPPELAAGVEAAAALVGEARARWMADDAPAAIVSGDALPEAPPIVASAPRGLRARLLSGRRRT